MYNFLQNQQSTIPFKVVILGLLTIIVISTSGILLIRKITNTSPLKITIPDKYNDPLIIAIFNNLLSIKPVNAVGVKGIVETLHATSPRNATSLQTLKYINPYPNTDVVQTQQTNKIKEDIILKKPGHPNEFKYQVNLEHYDYQIDEQNNLHFYLKGAKDTDNPNLYRFLTIPAPYMIDANGEQSPTNQVKMTLDKQGILTLIPNPAWLAKHTYPIILDPTIEINVLNLYSHPQTGDYWKVSFTTIGKADLKIIPDDIYTIRDDEFVGLYCNGEMVLPDILENNVIYYPDWLCQGQGQVIHYTKKAGKHKLRFEFTHPNDPDNPQIAYAHNDAGTDDPWWDTDWDYRRPITFNNATSSSDLTNFPVLVQLHEEPGQIDYGNTQDSGQDIRFINYDGTELDYEIENWNESATSTVWVEMPTIEGSTSTQYFYMYYGNQTVADNASSTAVWNDDYVGVWHMSETASSSGSLLDSTTYHKNGTPLSPSLGQTGKIDGAPDFDGDDDWISISGNTTIESVSLWINLNDVISTSYFIGGLGSVGIRYDGTDFLVYTADDIDEVAWTKVDEFVHVSVINIDNDAYDIYVNGIKIGTSNTGTGILDDITDFGQRGGYFFEGIMDEVRIMNTSTSTDWIAAEYWSVHTLTTYSSTTDDYVAFGAEEVQSGLTDVSNDWCSTYSNWDYRKKITFDNSNQSSNFSNFPAAVFLTATSSRIDYANIQDSGQDIRFCDSDNSTVLDYEIEEWNETATSTIWVEIPQLEASSSTDHVWLYYGNQTASDAATTTGVWDEHFMMVQHMQETASSSSSIIDSTRNDNDGTPTSPTLGQTGKIGPAPDFDGSDDYIDLPYGNAINPSTSPHTFSMWVESDTDSSGKVFFSSGQGTNDRMYLAAWSDDWEIGIQASAAGDTKTPHNKEWGYITLVMDGSNASLYVNGNYDYQKSYTSYSFNQNFDIGRHPTSPGTYDFDGMIDEVRISDTARSPDWIDFEYCNMMDTCGTYGSVEINPNLIDVSDVWWDNGWSYRMKITFDNSSQTSNFSDFPAAVFLTATSSRMDYSKTQDFGQDIRFVDSDNSTALDYEIEEWDKTATSTIWVQVPQIEASSSTDHIWMYYGNQIAYDNSTTTGVWDENFMMVQHMQETASSSDSIVDSTRNDNDGTPTSPVATTTNLKIDGAWEFDGDDDGINVGESFWDGSFMEHTITAWVKFEMKDTLNGGVFCKGSGSPNGFCYSVYGYGVGQSYKGGPRIRMSSTNKEATTKIDDGVWNFLSVVLDASNVYFYLNGVADGSDTHSYTGNNNTDAFIGSIDGAAGFNGVIDELRISSTARGADWIAFEYCNMMDTCSTYSSEQNEPNSTASDWWDSTWHYRKKATFNNATSSSNLTNFPVLVQLHEEPNNIDYNNTQVNGQDIRFIDYDGTVLDYEIEKWDETATSTVWVEMPSIEAGTSTQYFYMYYGKGGAASNSSSTAVWNSDYVGVWHLDEAYDASSDDSTIYHNDGTHTNFYSSTSTVDSKIGNGIDFDGSDDYITIPSTLNNGIGNEITVSAWIKADGSAFDSNTGIVSEAYLGDGNVCFALVGNHEDVDSTTVAAAFHNGGWKRVTNTGGDFHFQQWIHLVGTYDGSVIKIYLDGVLSNSNNDATGLASGAEEWRIGRRWDLEDNFNGSIDEVRIMNTATSTDWIAASYWSVHTLTSASTTDDYISWGEEDFQRGSSVGVKFR